MRFILNEQIPLFMKRSNQGRRSGVNGRDNRRSRLRKEMKRLISKFILALGLAAGVALLAPITPARRQDQLQDSEVIGYRNASGQDAVARLQRRINGGEVKLEY